MAEMAKIANMTKNHKMVKIATNIINARQNLSKQFITESKKGQIILLMVKNCNCHNGKTDNSRNSQISKVVEMAKNYLPVTKITKVDKTITKYL